MSTAEIEIDSEETPAEAGEEELTFARRRRQQAEELYRSTEALRGQVIRLRSAVVLLIAVVVVALIVIGLRDSDDE